MRNPITATLARLHSLSHPDPVRDWLILVSCSLLALVSLVVWNVWAFDRVANGGVIGTSMKSASPVFDQSTLNAVNAIFTDRAAEEAKYVHGFYQYADPSQ